MDAPLKQVCRDEIEGFIERLSCLSAAALNANQHDLSRFIDKAVDDLIFAKYSAPRDTMTVEERAERNARDG